MQYDFREGDWVRHRSYPKPLRVIGVGSTIAIEFSNGIMRAFEPSELKKVPTNEVARPAAPVQPVHVLRHDRLGPIEQLVLLTSVGLIWLMTLGVVIAIAGL